MVAITAARLLSERVFALGIIITAKNLLVPTLLLLVAGFSWGGDCDKGGASQFICGVPSAEDLIRIGDVFREVVVYLGVSQVTLFLASCNEVFQT